MATRGGRRPLIHCAAVLLQSTPVYRQPFTQGLALGWYAKPPWGLGKANDLALRR